MGVQTEAENAVLAPEMVSQTFNVASHLEMMAQRQPYTLAVIFPHGRDRHGRVSYTHFTYRQLNDECDRLAHGLRHVGIGRGVRTVLMVKPSLEFFALTFALFKLGAVPVLIDPGLGIRNLGQCLAEAEPEAFIGIPKAHAARVVLRWARSSIRTCVTVGRRWFWGGFTFEQVQQAGKGASSFESVSTAKNEQAAILFTSGSTGPPKGAVYTHGIFAAQVEILRRLYRIEPGEIDLQTFPLFGLFAPALGMTTVIPDMDPTRPAQVDPRKIIEAVENFGVTNLFGSPALLNRVGRFGAEQKLKLPALKRVLSAGAPVSAEVMERFTAILNPGVEIFTPYGATEALPVCSIGSSEVLGQTRSLTNQGAGVCVGRPVAEVKVKIIRISDEPIPVWSDDLVVPSGQVGEIVVQGQIVTREYFRRPEATLLAKIADAESFYHRMGDLGYLDEQGRVWFCGRKSHRVVTDKGTMFTIPCEAVFNTHPKVYRTALVGVRRAGSVNDRSATDRSLQPVLCVELEKDTHAINHNELRKELLVLARSQPHTASISTFLFHPAFPVDIRHNAKIFREKLAVWAARKLAR
jgi:olefin beta-lactone synthetase